MSTEHLPEMLERLSGYPYEPTYATHPGEFLLDELRERDMTQSDLARLTGLTQKHICQVVKGKASIGAEMALLLEREWGASAEMWMRLQMRRDLWAARNGKAGERAALLERIRGSA